MVFPAYAGLILLEAEYETKLVEVFPAYAGLILISPLSILNLTLVFPAYAGLILLYDGFLGEGRTKVFPAYAGLIPSSLWVSCDRCDGIPRLCGVDSFGDVKTMAGGDGIPRLCGVDSMLRFYQLRASELYSPPMRG